MAGRSKQKASYIPDPERRAYYQALRAVRVQVFHKYAKEIAESGFFARALLRLKIEAEIRRLTRDIKPPARR